jgi:S-DNA-T family DNA segregation ATPase FtsK/SpoIIIE
MTDTLPEAYVPPGDRNEPDQPPAEQTYASHLDIALDDEQPGPREPVFVDVVAKDDERRPIFPAALRSLENAKASARYHAERNAHRLGYHAVRSPIYLPKALFWALIGVVRMIGRAFRWWWHPELTALEQEAANQGDLHAGPRIAAQASEARRNRFFVLFAALIGLAVGSALVWFLAPGWVQAAIVSVLLPWLAHVGRPKTMPIVRSAVVTQRIRRINSDIVLRAYYAAGLGHPEKPDQQVEFGGTMWRDPRETGSGVTVDLPFGKTFADVRDAKAKLASGLDVHINQVFLTKGNKEREHTLFVADEDPLAFPVGRTDMLDCKPRNVWRPMPIGKDERFNLVMLSLLWNSVLVGAMPRKGKTFFVRLLLLYAALDPWVKILFADGKKSPDYDKLKLVAHRMVIGDAPNPRDDDPLEHLEDMLDEVLDHIAEVNDVLSTLPVEMCPEGKLTEELARDPRYPALRVWILAGEEFQVYFETEDQDYNIRIANKWGRIMAQGPSAGVILADSSQKPTRVGKGDVSRLFDRFRDNHQVRFALRCGNRHVSEGVLGGDAYAEGHDASALPIGDGSNGTKDYRGIGILYGASDVTPVVRTFMADHADAEKILIAARARRERLGLLSGVSAGEETHKEYRDVMADARSVFYAGEAKISWPELAERMAREIPEHYAEITADAISAQLRHLGVKAKSVRDAKHFEKGVGQGFELIALDDAIAKRALGS